MGKLPFLLVILLVASHYQAHAKFPSLNTMMGCVDVASDLYSGISDSVKLFTEPQNVSTPSVIQDNAQIVEASKNKFNVLNQLNSSVSEINDNADALHNNVEVINRNVGDLIESSIRMDKTLTNVLHKMDYIINQLAIIPSAISSRMNELLKSLGKRLSNKQFMNEGMQKLSQSITRIDQWFDLFLDCLNLQKPLLSSTVDNVISVITSDNALSLKHTLDHMYSMFTASDDSSTIFSSLLVFVTQNEQFLEFSEKCDLQLSFQDHIRIIYNLVAASEIRGFIMTVYAYHYKQVKSNYTVNYTGELESAVRYTLNHMKGYLQAMKNATESSSAEIYRCDQQKHIIDDNCFRLDSLFGLYYLNAKQLDEKCNIPKNLNLENVVINHLDSSSAFIKTYTPKYKCNGRLHNCTNADPMSFCESRIGTGRRYEWISAETGPMKMQDCRGRYIDTLVYSECQNLICQCSEEGPRTQATRTISLRPQCSDIKNNKVVTNVRLRKKDNIVHIQIQQGALLNEGRINTSTLEWVPLGKFSQINSDNGEIELVWSNGTMQETLIHDQDYTYLTYNRAQLNIDDVTVEKDYIVTGVKFGAEHPNPKNGWNSSPIQLEIHTTRFDYYEGKLLLGNDYTSDYCKNDVSGPWKWINAKHVDAHKNKRYGWQREELDMSNKDNPLKGVNNEIDSSANERVTFQPTSYKKDFGQSTVPYFDSRPAIIKSGVALGGIGLTHRAAKGYGGFIAPKVFTLNHVDYIGYDIDINAKVSEIVKKLGKKEEEKTNDYDDYSSY